jgi:uncharacterized glyoxalase superfamily protein PhnB
MPAIVPQLPVADVIATQHYYRDVLGFRIGWLWDNDFGAVLNDEVEIFFSKEEKPATGFTIYLFVENADALHEAYTASGADIVEPISSTPWGMREFVVRDINGHLLRIGHGEKGTAEIERFQVGESIK